MIFPGGSLYQGLPALDHMRNHQSLPNRTASWHDWFEPTVTPGCQNPLQWGKPDLESLWTVTMYTWLRKMCKLKNALFCSWWSKNGPKRCKDLCGILVPNSSSYQLPFFTTVRTACRWISMPLWLRENLVGFVYTYYTWLLGFGKTHWDKKFG